MNIKNDKNPQSRVSLCLNRNNVCFQSNKEIKINNKLLVSLGYPRLNFKYKLDNFFSISKLISLTVEASSCDQSQSYLHWNTSGRVRSLCPRIRIRPRWRLRPGPDCSGGQVFGLRPEVWRTASDRRRLSQSEIDSDWLKSEMTKMNFIENCFCNLRNV